MIAGLLWTAGPTVVVECRRCGATLEAEADPCPYCGPTDQVVYEIR